MVVLTRDQVTTYARQAGFSGQALQIAVAIAQAESSFDTISTHLNWDLSTDRGLWQINSVHREYDANRLLADPAYNAAAAYAISSRGTNWTPWVTFNKGTYLKYMAAGSGGTSSGSSTPIVQQATANTYPRGQCTWWAAQRYHDRAGYYVPWKLNAKDWVSGAQGSGWQVSSRPSVPSIIVLQGGVQGASAQFGHVAFVEKINADGSVLTSDQNWNGTSATTYVNFTPGNGVSFITAAAGGTTGGTTIPVSLTTSSSGAASYVPLLAQVHETLVNTPGFYGLARAIDEAEQYPGYVNLASSPVDITGQIRSVGATITDNFVPLLIRSGIYMLGFILVMLLIAKAVQGPVNDAKNQVSSAMPLIMLAAGA